MDAAPDDEQLMNRCQQGDEAALALLVQRYQRRVIGLARRIGTDDASAEEIAVETFFKLWKSSRSWKGQASVSTWIYRIAVRTALDSQRGNVRWQRRLLLFFQREQPEAALDPIDQSIVDESCQQRKKQLDKALESLPINDRTLVHLYYFEDKSLAEIEPILEVSKDALKTRLARIRKRLRAILGPSQEQ